jgi:hypothetical protein
MKKFYKKLMVNGICFEGMEDAAAELVASPAQFLEGDIPSQVEIFREKYNLPTWVAKSVFYEFDYHHNGKRTIKALPQVLPKFYKELMG